MALSKVDTIFHKVLRICSSAEIELLDKRLSAELGCRKKKYGADYEKKKWGD